MDCKTCEAAIAELEVTSTPVTEAGKRLVAGCPVITSMASRVDLYGLKSSAIMATARSTRALRRTGVTRRRRFGRGFRKIDDGEKVGCVRARGSNGTLGRTGVRDIGRIASWGKTDLAGDPSGGLAKADPRKCGGT